MQVKKNLKFQNIFLAQKSCQMYSDVLTSFRCEKSRQKILTCHWAVGLQSSTPDSVTRQAVWPNIHLVIIVCDYHLQYNVIYANYDDV